LLRDNPHVTATVEGHTDSTGSAQYNQWLSERRAESVRQLMVEKHGVSAAQIRAVGYGPVRPIADNESEIGRSQNRRVDLVLDGGTEG